RPRSRPVARPAPRWTPCTRRAGYARSPRGSCGAAASPTTRVPAAGCRRARPRGPGAPASHARDQPVHPFVVRAERVLAQHGALGLVVELEVDPVDGEVAPLLLRVPDELAAQPGPRGLRRGLLGLEDLHVVGHPVDLAAL